MINCNEDSHRKFACRFPLDTLESNTMKRSFLKLMASTVFLATPFTALAVDAAVAPAGPVLLLTSDTLNAAITGQAGLNNAFKKEVTTFAGKLKALLESTGRITIAKDTTAIELTNTGHPLAVALASLLPQQMSHVGTVYWGPDASNNILITVDFYPVIYTTTTGWFKLGDKNYGKKMLFLAAGSGVPANTADRLATEFNEHLATTVFKQ